MVSKDEPGHLSLLFVQELVRVASSAQLLKFLRIVVAKMVEVLHAIAASQDILGQFLLALLNEARVIGNNVFGIQELGNVIHDGLGDVVLDVFYQLVSICIPLAEIGHTRDGRILLRIDAHRVRAAALASSSGRSGDNRSRGLLNGQ